MSKATYFQRGESLDFFNKTTEKIEAFSIIPLISRIGIAGDDIGPGEVGAIAVSGVFEMPKKDSTAIPMGTLVYYDGTGITTTVSGSTLAGYAAADAAAGDDSMIVKLLG
jgi:predicted RecA/RadA family phage recombinase